MAIPSSRRKLEWARSHHAELERNLGLWRAAGRSQGVLAMVENPEGTERRYYVTPPPIPPAVPLIIGDVLHNAHSALDAWAWDIVEAQGAMPASSGAQNRIQFPLYSTAERLERELPKRLPGVGREALDVVKDLQPDPDDLEASPLWWLYKLSSVDKHRSVHVVGLSGGDNQEGDRQSRIWVEPTGLDVEVGIANGIVESGAMIAFARGINLPRVQVKVGYGVRPVILDPGPPKRRLSLDIIESIVDAVGTALDRLEPLV